MKSESSSTRVPEKKRCQHRRSMLRRRGWIGRPITSRRSQGRHLGETRCDRGRKFDVACILVLGGQGRKPRRGDEIPPLYHQTSHDVKVTDEDGLLSRSMMIKANNTIMKERIWINRVASKIVFQSGIQTMVLRCTMSVCVRLQFERNPICT